MQATRLRVPAAARPGCSHSAFCSAPHFLLPAAPLLPAARPSYSQRIVVLPALSKPSTCGKKVKGQSMQGEAAKTSEPHRMRASSGYQSVTHIREDTRPPMPPAASAPAPTRMRASLSPNKLSSRENQSPCGRARQAAEPRSTVAAAAAADQRRAQTAGWAADRYAIVPLVPTSRLKARQAPGGGESGSCRSRGGLWAVPGYHVLL